MMAAHAVEQLTLNEKRPVIYKCLVISETRARRILRCYLDDVITLSMNNTRTALLPASYAAFRHQYMPLA